MQIIELTLASITGAVIDAVDAVPGVLALAIDGTTMLVQVDGPSETTLERAIEGAGGEVLTVVTRAPPSAAERPLHPGADTDGPDVDALLYDRIDD